MKNGIKQSIETGSDRVYNFLVHFIMENGNPSNIREICAGIYLCSTSSVYDYLVDLEMLGEIEMKEKTPREIRLIGYKFVKAEERA